MKKTLLTIASIGITMCAFAQNQKLSNNAVTVSNLIANETISLAQSASTPTTTIMIPPSFASTTCSLTTGYNTTGGGVGGYVAGTNQYGDLEKAMKYKLSDYGLTLPATINQTLLYVGVKKAGGPGTGVISVKIYADNAGAPGALLGTSTTSLVSALTAPSYSNNVFTFTTPVNITTSSFFVSADFSAANLDTLGLVSTISSTATPCVFTSSVSAWEYFQGVPTNAWQTILAGWGLTVDLGIFPVVTAETVSVKENSLTETLVSIFPNPSNGLVNVVSKTNQNLTVDVSNVLGQVVSSSTINSSSTKNHTIDLASQNNGIYFVTVSNGTDKVVKRIVLSK
jgi:Secretion system C-terminal sorting domain